MKYWLRDCDKCGKTLICLNEIEILDEETNMAYFWCDKCDIEYNEELRGDE